MMASVDEDLPWRVLFFPALSKRNAKRLLKLAIASGICEDGELSSPRTALALGLDRVTVQWLRAALSEEDSVVLNHAGDALESISPTEARERCASLIEDLDEFLGYSDRYMVERRG